mmetsp:Transcript_123276/g.282631  ORF Transcript_123276/g.282631 Transcript_123276/m.282631 type:complete len:268 (-) Transcript_123276:163-966(-)
MFDLQWEAHLQARRGCQPWPSTRPANFCAHSARGISMDELMGEDWSVITLQEVNLARQLRNAVRAECRAQGYRIVFGCPTENGQILVAVMTRMSVRVTGLHLPVANTLAAQIYEEEQCQQDFQARVLPVLVTVDATHTLLTTVYSFASSVAASHALATDVWSALATAVKPATPIVVVGDFNTFYMETTNGHLCSKRCADYSHRLRGDEPLVGAHAEDCKYDTSSTLCAVPTIPSQPPAELSLAWGAAHSHVAAGEIPGPTGCRVVAY